MALKFVRKKKFDRKKVNTFSNNFLLRFFYHFNFICSFLTVNNGMRKKNSREMFFFLRFVFAYVFRLCKFSSYLISVNCSIAHFHSWFLLLLPLIRFNFNGIFLMVSTCKLSSKHESQFFEWKILHPHSFSLFPIGVVFILLFCFGLDFS